MMMKARAKWIWHDCCMEEWQHNQQHRLLRRHLQGLGQRAGAPASLISGRWPPLVSSSCSPVLRPLRASPFSFPPDDSPSQQPPFLEDIVIPPSWTSQASATEESEWLRTSLHQWLDDEFCPEPANEEISRRCSKVYYYCLMEKQLDLGDILMQMVRELESFSFKESFHGAFSSANAAVDLITKRIRTLEGES